MKLVFLLLLFLSGSMFPAQDMARVKHIYEDFQIMASGVDFRGMSHRKFASKWKEQYSSIKESNLVDILIVQDKKTKKYGYVTFDNKKVTPIEYDDAQGFGYPEKIAWVKKNNKWGGINLKGENVIPFLYEEVQEFSSSRALVKFKGQWGFVDKDGKMLIPAEYEEAESFHYNTDYTKAKKNGLWGFINKDGKTLIPFEYDVIRTDDYYPKPKDKIRAVKNGKMGVIDWDNKIIIPFIYANILPATEDIHVVFKDGKIGYIKETGEILVSPKYETMWLIFHHYVSRFEKGTALVKLNDKFGFINTQGEEIIPCKYEAVKGSYFREGIIPVRYNGKWGYINQKNEIIAPFVYDEAEYFSNSFSDIENGFAKVRRGDKWGYINTEGKEVIPVIYDKLGNYIFKGLCEAKRDEKWGFVNTEGKEVIPIIYDWVNLFNSCGGSIEAHLGKKKFYMDLQGNPKEE